MTIELNPQFTFDSFIVGESNRLAVAAARAVAENPGEAYNPLYVYGGGGLGKTHLMTAIGHKAKELSRAVTVEYLTLDEFVEQYHASVSVGQIDEFRTRLLHRDILLIDDVQFLIHRKEMQSELLRLTSEFQQDGKQVVMTSDCSPTEISDLDDRLLDRISGGLVLDIESPSYEMRLAILERRSVERNTRFGEGVLEAVADCEIGSVREMLGVLNRLVAFQAVSETALTESAARALVTGDTGSGVAQASELETPLLTSAADDRRPTDEFGDFLSDVTTTVTQQVEVWKSRLSDAIQFWSEKGYQTDKLERMLDSPTPTAPDTILREFEESVLRLRVLENKMSELNPVAARNPVFRDPDKVDEAEEAIRRFREELQPPPGPSGAFVLEDFVSGEPTKMAIGAARAVLEAPGKRYNPLVLVGPSGVGKSHLLHAIGRGLQQQGVGVVACLSAQMFLDELVAAIEKDAVDAWRARYRSASAFLLDDVELICSRDRTQEELFNLFNVFAEAGRQLVFTSKVPPKEIDGLESRLASRLEGGLVATLGLPDRDLQTAVLRRQLGVRAGSVDEELVTYLAERPAESIRSVLGLLERVFSAAEVHGRPPSIELAQRLLEGPVRSAADGTRTSGVVIVPSGGIKSVEKVVWHWPEPELRLIEDTA